MTQYSQDTLGRQELREVLQSGISNLISEE